MNNKNQEVQGRPLPGGHAAIPAEIPDSVFSACARAAENVLELESFKHWIRDYVRPVLPHDAFVCAHGGLYGAGVSLDYVVTVDYPHEHLQAIRTPSGHMDTPLAHRWYKQRTPVFFDANHPSDNIPATWLAYFRKHELRNAAADGVLDYTNCIGTYFSFHRLPALDEQQLTNTFKKLTPLLHQTFARVIRHHRASAAPSLHKHNNLTGREQEIATWISQGKGNGDIASLLGVSENTIRNHVSRILEKMHCNNRTELAAAILLQEQHRYGMGTKVL